MALQRMELSEPATQVAADSYTQTEGGELCRLTRGLLLLLCAVCLCT